MKKFIVTILGITTLVIAGCTPTNDTLFQYPFKSAKIEYTIGGITEGKSTLMLKGDKSVRETHVVFHKAGQDIHQDNLQINLGNNIYDIDLDKKTGTMMENPLYKKLIATSPDERLNLLSKISLGISPEDAMKKEIQIVGRDIIAGKNCDIYPGNGIGAYCLWHSIPLKISISISNTDIGNSTVATSVQTDIDIPDSAFEVPADIKIKKI